MATRLPRRRSVRLVRPAKRPERPAPDTTRAAVEPSVQDWGDIGRIYDLEHPACRGTELAFWDREATDAGGEVLELAAGSGRVAIALARKGHRVTGLDSSAGMLARAAARTGRLPPDVQERLTWEQGDMADFDLSGRRFGLVFIAYNSFWLLTDETRRRQCLRSVARHLAPGGRLVLDLFPPNEDDYQDETGIAQQLPTPIRGRPIVRIKDYCYDSARQVAVSDVRYYAEDLATDEPAQLLATFRYELSPAPPETVVALLEGEGYTVRDVHGRYTCEPLTPVSPRAIFVAERAEGRP
ncbi:MAG: class I SAM-dependent methyltransferase [Chloroflexi bacterium]|nr:class I SAM-dependent methyltransferase [Chloroflexota bacterium]